MDIDQGKLLRGKPIFIENVGILKPVIIDEIIDIGEKQYYQYLQQLCFDIDELQLSNEEKQEIIDSDVTTFQLIISKCSNDSDYLNLILSALKFFFKDDVYFLNQYGIFYLGDFNESHFITDDNYESIKSVLKLQNGLSKNDILDENPKDERTRILLEKRRKAREKLARAKAREKENDGESETITFVDLISIMCANANGVNHENVWNMNYYMFQNQFQRMKLIDDFDISIRSLLAGAKSDDIELKHYISHL